MHVLVTGGAGYIGSHIVKELCNQKVDVTVFDNFNTGLRENLDSRAGLIEGDIKNVKDLRSAFETSYDAVFHFAALKAVGESMERPDIYAQNNICGTLNILNIMAEKGVSNFIFSSSAGLEKMTGRTPWFIRLSWWIRAKLLASTTFTPRNIGAMAACSLEEP